MKDPEKLFKNFKIGTYQEVFGEEPLGKNKLDYAWEGTYNGSVYSGIECGKPFKGGTVTREQAIKRLIRQAIRIWNGLQLSKKSNKELFTKVNTLFTDYKVGKVEDVYTQDMLGDDIKNPPKNTCFYGWRGKYKDKEYGNILGVVSEVSDLEEVVIRRLNYCALMTYSAIIEGRLIKKLGERGIPSNGYTQ